MKLNYLYIKDYKKYKDQEIYFSQDDEYSKEEEQVYRQYYPKVNFMALVGENGTGKTTLLSFLINIFHNLERFHKRIPSDFILKYEINLRDKDFNVRLSKERGSIFITIDNFIVNCLLLERKYIKKGEDIYPSNTYPYYNGKKTITYEEIKEFLPPNIITSVFFLDRVYPGSRPVNYQGEKLLENYEVSKIHWDGKYSFSHLSQSIAGFINLYYKQRKQFEHAMSLLALEFTGKVNVKTRSRLGNDNLEQQKEKWNDFSSVNKKEIKEFLKNEKEGTIYFTDLIFKKGNQLICLSDMSSGEKIFMVRLLSILSTIRNNSIVIIEEPEFHLNPFWIKQLTTFLPELFNSHNCQFILATHSHWFISSLFPSNILVFENDSIAHPNFNTFLANEAEITYKLFRNTLKSNYVEEKVMNKILSANNIEEIEEIISYLGESHIRFLAYKKLKELRSWDSVED